MKKIAILGPGLLGGSIALALRERGGTHVAMWARRPEAVAEVRAAGCAETVSTEIGEIVKDADIIVFATPIEAMPTLAREIAGHVAPEALITDVGSVKASVVAELGGIFQGRARFIGSHPMAGSEQTGLSAARADLFSGRVCIVTPTAETDASSVRDSAAFWESLGSIVHVLAPDAHDEAVAWISHLPHLLAPALVSVVATHAPDALAFCGPGFHSSARLAGSPPSMWTGIFAQNHAAVRKSLDALIEKLRELSTILSRADSERDLLMNEFLNQAKAQRDRLRLPN